MDLISKAKKFLANFLFYVCSFLICFAIISFVMSYALSVNIVISILCAVAVSTCIQYAIFTIHSKCIKMEDLAIESAREVNSEFIHEINGEERVNLHNKNVSSFQNNVCKTILQSIVQPYLE